VKIEVKVITRAKREGVEKVSGNIYKVKVCSPPEKGRANKRVIELLSEKFEVKEKDIRIASGETNNRKIIEINL